MINYLSQIVIEYVGIRKYIDKLSKSNTEIEIFEKIKFSDRDMNYLLHKTCMRGNLYQIKRILTLTPKQFESAVRISCQYCHLHLLKFFQTHFNHIYTIKELEWDDETKVKKFCKPCRTELTKYLMEKIQINPYVFLKWSILYENLELSEWIISKFKITESFFENDGNDAIGKCIEMNNINSLKMLFDTFSNYFFTSKRPEWIYMIINSDFDTYRLIVKHCYESEDFRNNDILCRLIRHFDKFKWTVDRFNIYSCIDCIYADLKFNCNNNTEALEYLELKLNRGI